MLKEKLVIGTTTPEICPGGIPRFIDYMKKSPDYSNSVFLEWCEQESPRQLSLGKFRKNKILRTITAQFLVLKFAHRFESIEVHSVRTGLSALIFHRRKCVFFYHGPGFQEAAVENVGTFKVLILYIIEALMLSGLQGYRVASRAFKKRLIENHGIPSDRIAVIRPYVPFDRRIYLQELERKWEADEEDRELSCVICRRLVNRVGVLDFVKRFKEREFNNRVSINIVGSGPQGSIIEGESESDSRLIFHGELSEEGKNEIYKNSIFNIVPTTHLEGLGMVIYEGLAYGCIPLVTDCDGMPELIDELQVGSYFRDLDLILEALSEDSVFFEINRQNVIQNL